MKFRRLGKTGFNISEISLGTWQLGTKWGDPFNAKEAEHVLETALEQGINFIDTADVYNDGMSEKAIGSFLKKHTGETIYVATKCGRQLDPHVAEGYNEKNIRRFVESSLKNMAVEKLDLIQLHCPPTPVFYKPEVFDALDRLKNEGKILNYGVSVERVEEGLKSLDYEGVCSIQIIYNMFRHRPAETLFKRAKESDVGIIVRVPLASGLLTGKFSADTRFGKDDHRTFNRDGAAFDKGETFSGVEYQKGLEAVEQLKQLFHTQQLAPYALRWVLMAPEVSTVIPGASRAEQVLSNVAADALAPLTPEQMAGVRQIYEKYLKNPVHYLW